MTEVGDANDRLVKKIAVMLCRSDRARRLQQILHARRDSANTDNLVSMLSTAEGRAPSPSPSQTDSHGRTW